MRDRASLARVVDEGWVENVYRLQIMNATEVPQRYRVQAEGMDGLQIASDTMVQVGPAESRWLAVRLQIPYGSAAPGSHTVYFDIQARGDKVQVAEKAVFLVPR